MLRTFYGYPGEETRGPSRGKGKKVRISGDDQTSLKRIENMLSNLYKRASDGFQTYRTYKQYLKSLIMMELESLSLHSRIHDIKIAADTPGDGGWGYGFYNLKTEIYYKHRKANKTTIVTATLLIDGKRYFGGLDYRDAWFNNGICGC